MEQALDDPRDAVEPLEALGARRRPSRGAPSPAPAARPATSFGTTGRRARRGARGSRARRRAGCSPRGRRPRPGRPTLSRRWRCWSSARGATARCGRAARGSARRAGPANARTAPLRSSTRRPSQVSSSISAPPRRRRAARAAPPPRPAARGSRSVAGEARPAEHLAAVAEDALARAVQVDHHAVGVGRARRRRGARSITSRCTMGCDVEERVAVDRHDDEERGYADRGGRQRDSRGGIHSRSVVEWASERERRGRRRSAPARQRSSRGAEARRPRAHEAEADQQVGVAPELERPEARARPLATGGSGRRRRREARGGASRS